MSISYQRGKKTWKIKTENGILYVTAKRIKNHELLILYSNKYINRKALYCYKKRWSIECLFKAMKKAKF